MAEVNEERLKHVERTKKDLHAYLREKDFTFTNIIHFLSQYRSACEELILQDFEYSVGKDIENKLWDSHGRINNLFRKELKYFREAVGKKKPVEQRKATKHFLDFIKSSQRFYRGFIQRLASCFNGVPELEAVASRLTLSTLSIDEPTQISGALAHSVLLSCHQTLVRLGDLSRWRETELVTKDRNWGPPIGYYDLARIIYPNSGASHNQLAVIALADSNHLRATYHLYRALAVEEPHPGAKGNLEIEFRKAQEAPCDDDIVGCDYAGDSQGSYEALARQFIRLHARCYRGNDAPGNEDDESEVMRHLTVEVKERSLEGILNKFVLVNIAAQYFTEIRLKGDPNSIDIVSSFFNLLRLNVITFFTLLQILLSELERHGGEELQSSGNRSGSAKLTAVTRRVLPSLRHYSSWLASNATILAAGVGDAALSVQVRELWKIYANALTLLVSTFPVSGLPPPIDYMLEEDEDTLAFKPLDNEYAQRRYYSEVTGLRKPKWHDRGVHRQHPNIEMLGRIRDFLTDGMVIHSHEGVPIQLLGTTFVYVEDSMSADEGLQESHPPAHAEYPEVTHVDETVFPRTLESVNDGGLPADLISINSDLASKRMVDDLVGSETVDDESEEPLQLQMARSTSAEVINETSYGLFGTSTASELAARAETQNQPLVAAPPLLPSIYNSPFALQPGEATPNSRPSTAKRSTPSHSRQNSQVTFPFQQPRVHRIDSSQSSMPEPTNPNPPMYEGYYGNTSMNQKFLNNTKHTMGGRSSIACGNDGFSALDACHFISPTVDFGCSGSVKGTTNVQTPPNGQGAGSQISITDKSLRKAYLQSASSTS